MAAAVPGMTVLFLVASTFTLAKVVRIDEARLEKLLAEHNPFTTG